MQPKTFFVLLLICANVIPLAAMEKPPRHPTTQKPGTISLRNIKIPRDHVEIDYFGEDNKPGIFLRIHFATHDRVKKDILIEAHDGRYVKQTVYTQNLFSFDTEESGQRTLEIICTKNFAGKITCLLLGANPFVWYVLPEEQYVKLEEIYNGQDNTIKLDPDLLDDGTLVQDEEIHEKKETKIVHAVPAEPATAACACPPPAPAAAQAPATACLRAATPPRLPHPPQRPYPASPRAASARAVTGRKPLGTKK